MLEVDVVDDDDEASPLSSTRQHRLTSRELRTSAANGSLIIAVGMRSRC